VFDKGRGSAIAIGRSRDPQIAPARLCSGPVFGLAARHECGAGKNRFGNNGTDAAASQESGKRNDDVDEKDDDVAHWAIVAKNCKCKEMQLKES
jgi:hypothetical protein